MNYVWYASYGSNIDQARFSCYIEGKQAEGSCEIERGCRNAEPPKADRLIDIHYPLYFSKQESKWGKGGVAFIGHRYSEEEKTIGRMYLISEEQFLDVTSQENGLDEIEVDLEEVKDTGFKALTDDWYGRIVYLGECEGYPIYTFTSHYEMGEEAFAVPAFSYLKTIARGLQNGGLNKEEVAAYFLEKNGVKGSLTKEQLLKEI